MKAMNQHLLSSLVGLSCLVYSGKAFVTRSVRSGHSLAARHRQTFSRPASTLSSSSYGQDSDEDAEQRLGEKVVEVVVDSPPEAAKPSPNGGGHDVVGRYDDLLADVGLEGKLKQASELPAARKISSHDIFCNRELGLDMIGAIGFDMVR
jgi:hypothetical protein